MNTENKIRHPTCEQCGTTNINVDAFAFWNHQKQIWDLLTTLDTANCEECGGECTIEWKEGDPLDLPINFPSISETGIALLLVSDTDADVTVISKWTNPERKLAYDWAMAVHFYASDNDDVVIPPRPNFIPRKEPSDDL